MVRDSAEYDSEYREKLKSISLEDLTSVSKIFVQNERINCILKSLGPKKRDLGKKLRTQVKLKYRVGQ